MQEKASTYGLQINWSKTKILQVPSSSSSSTVQVADGHVEVVDAFVYLGCMIDSSGSSRGEVLRRIGLARSCMNMLERRIWKSSIRLETKLCLYQTYIVPVLMYGCETWTSTKYLLSRLDASDTWALRKILRIPCTCHVSNAEVRRTTGCSPLSHMVTNRRLRLFGHIAHSSPHEDHRRALAACIRQVPPDWKRPAGRPSHTWLRAIEADLGSLNCLEKGHYSRRMATYCGHSNAPAEYVLKEEEEECHTAGGMFHKCGPVTVKLLSPRCDSVQSVAQESSSVERGQLRPTSETS